MSDTASIARDGPELRGPELHLRLTAAWRREPGLIGWLSTTDHKEVGKRYIVTAFVFMALAGVLALVMRAQLARPESGLISADRYNQIFTMHGTTMMFLFAVPVMEAVAIYVIPLMLGTRNLSFSRLNAFSYWMYLFGGVLLWVAFVLNVGPDANGELPPTAIERLHEIGAWMKVNGRAIHSSRAIAPYRDGKFRYTHLRDGTVYAIYLPDENEKSLPKILRIPGPAPRAGTQVTLLGADTPLAWRRDGNTTVVEVPAAIRKSTANAHAWSIRLPGAASPR